APRFPRFSARSAQTVHDRRRPRELRRERPHPRPVTCSRPIVAKCRARARRNRRAPVAPRPFRVHGGPMLDEFPVTNREAILANARERVAARQSPKPTDAELANGIPVFLDQLGDALRLASSSGGVAHDEIRASATRHGSDLLHQGLTIAQVVHDYGDVCQTITEMAIDLRAPITGEEFRTLNLCLDEAIAQAVTEYLRQRQQQLSDQGTERLGILAHEMRNLLNTAMLAFGTIKSGTVAAA